MVYESAHFNSNRVTYLQHSEWATSQTFFLWKKCFRFLQAVTRFVIKPMIWYWKEFFQDTEDRIMKCKDGIKSKKEPFFFSLHKSENKILNSCFYELEDDFMNLHTPIIIIFFFLQKASFLHRLLNRSCYKCYGLESLQCYGLVENNMYITDH